MKIVVLFKEVPDTYHDRKLDLTTGLADRDASERIPDEISERALEVALAYADAHSGTEVILLSMAPEAATASIRKGLSMGATRAVHIADPALAGADALLTARVLTAALRQTGFDLVLAGDAATDGAGGVIPAMAAELLGTPHLTNLLDLTISESAVTGSRGGADRITAARAPLPAVASISESFPEPRFPNFKGIMAAKKKPLEVLTLADLGITPPADEDPASIMLSISQRPSRSAGVRVHDEGAAAQQILDYLVERSLISLGGK